MASLSELQETRSKRLAELKAIAAEAAGRGFTDDEREILTDGKADIERLDASIEQARKDLALADELNSASDPQPAPRKVKPEAIKVADNFLSDPKRGFDTPREFLLCVMESGKSQRIDDHRLKSLAAGSDEASGTADPFGGFLLPAGFIPDLMTVASETDPTTGRTRSIPMASPQVKIPARTDKTHTSSVSGGLQVYRRNETDTVSATRMTVEQVTLNANSLFGLSYATEELLERSPISFAALLSEGFAQEFAAKLLKEKLFGTGAGEYEGVVNCPATVSVAKEVGQSADTIVYENVIKMRSRCWGYQNAVWIANHDTLPQLMIMSLAIGTGGSAVWAPSAVPDAPDMLLGRPIYFSEFAETVGDVGDIILGNWSEYLEGYIGGTTPRSAESMHVRFTNHERAFKFWLENDGRCWWRSALTPNQSSSTLSPFVTLAARA